MAKALNNNYLIKELQMEKCAAQLENELFETKDALSELLEFELAVVGGGIGDVILG